MPSELDESRKNISSIDTEIAELYKKRMAEVRRIAAWKKERGLPVYDERREEEIIRSQQERIEDPMLREYYVDFLRDVMKNSRAYQRRLITGARIAFSGVPGAFASEAAGILFPEGERVPFHDFESAYNSVVSGECDAAVLPIENSFSGDVGAVCDLIFSGPLYINRILDLSVTQNLLALPGADLAAIKTVVSHPQALSQCGPYIKSHGFTSREYDNTARAARYVAELGDPSVAAIGTEEAARLYGLNVLERRINESGQNTTRFAVLSRAENVREGKQDDNFFLVFSVRDQAGSLAEAVSIIGKHGYNLRSLRSRPHGTLLWKYYFCAEGEGDVRNWNGEAMMKELSGVCDRLRLVGSYPAERG